MVTLALASGIKQFLQRHLASSHRSPGEVVVIAALGILLAAIAKYLDRALFARARKPTAGIDGERTTVPDTQTGV